MHLPLMPIREYMNIAIMLEVARVSINNSSGTNVESYRVLTCNVTQATGKIKNLGAILFTNLLEYFNGSASMRTSTTFCTKISSQIRRIKTSRLEPRVMLVRFGECFVKVITNLGYYTVD
jgi:hypothetical protein